MSDTISHPINSPDEKEVTRLFGQLVSTIRRRETLLIDLLYSVRVSQKEIVDWLNKNGQQISQGRFAKLFPMKKGEKHVSAGD